VPRTYSIRKLPLITAIIVDKIISKIKRMGSALYNDEIVGRIRIIPMVAITDNARQTKDPAVPHGVTNEAGRNIESRAHIVSSRGKPGCLNAEPRICFNRKLSDVFSPGLFTLF
jgi:hypothetical protein